MPDTLLASYGKLVILLHTVSALVLVGATSHHLVVAIGYLRGRCRPRLGRTYAAVVAIAYLTTFVLGGIAYPSFRYHVRALYLDRHAVWASNLFDVKENFASIGLPVAVGTFLLSRAMDPKHDGPMLSGYAVLVIATTAIVWFNVISGLLITMAKSV